MNCWPGEQTGHINPDVKTGTEYLEEHYNQTYNDIRYAVCTMKSSPRQICRNQTIYDDIKYPNPQPSETSLFHNISQQYFEASEGLNLEFALCITYIVTGVILAIMFGAVLLRGYQMNKMAG